jgi:hypothetical protein
VEGNVVVVVAVVEDAHVSVEVSVQLQLVAVALEVVGKHAMQALAALGVEDDEPVVDGASEVRDASEEETPVVKEAEVALALVEHGEEELLEMTDAVRAA